MHDKFHLWRINMDSRKVLQNETEQVLVKYLRRYKRLAFNRFKDKVNQVK